MDTLPEELVLQIFQIVFDQRLRRKQVLNTRNGTNDLHRLSLVSRRFNRIVTPMLYEHIRAPPFSSNLFWNQIVETLHYNHALAQLVQSFSMTEHAVRTGSTPPRTLRSQSFVSLLPMLSSYKTFTNSDLILHLENRSRRGDNILAAFLVLQAPALVKLEVAGLCNYDNHHGPKHLPLVIEEMGHSIIQDLDAGMHPQCFRSLQDLHIDLRDWGYFPPSGLIPFLYIPRLKRLSLKDWGYQSNRSKRRRVNPFVSAKAWPVRTSAVEELILDSVCVSPYNMKKLLSACSALKKFECTILYMRQEQVEFWYRRISDALLDHAVSLESAILISSNSGHRLLPEALQHISSWKSLKMLQITYSTLVGKGPRRNIMEYLPPSLEYLVLHFTHWMLAEKGTDIDGFVIETCEAIYKGHLEGMLPHLKGIQLTAEWRPFFSSVPRPDVRHFISAFDTHDIKIGVSMFANYYSVTPPTEEDMQLLKTLFPGITTWCKGHRILRMSTHAEPCVLGCKQPNEWVYPSKWGKGLCGGFWNNRDCENDSDTVSPEV